MRTYWLIPGFALLLLGAGCALSKSQTSQEVEQVTAQADQPVPAKEPEMKAMVAAEPSFMAAAEATSLIKTVVLRGGEFFFEPAVIKAEVNEQILITFGSVAGDHTFTIDELSISQDMTPGSSVSFTAPATPGRYTYYCSHGPHRTLGMTGVLVVE